MCRLWCSIRLNKLRDLGPLALMEPVQAVADVVMRGFSTCVLVPQMAQAIKEVPLFHGMNNEQATRLAGAFSVREIRAGERLFAQHDPADRLYLVLQGQIIISGGSPQSGSAPSSQEKPVARSRSFRPDPIPQRRQRRGTWRRPNYPGAISWTSSAAAPTSA